MKLVRDSKPSLDELIHYGVKGMRWGQRKAKVTSADIRSARERHNARVTQLHGLAVSGLSSNSKAKRATIVKQIHNIANEGLRSGDVSIASRVTTGEKLAVALLAGGVGRVLVHNRMRRQNEVANAVLTKYSKIKVSDFG